MRVLLRLPFVALLLGLAAISGSDASSVERSSVASFRVVNVVSNSPTLSTMLGSIPIGNVSYGQATALRNVAPGDYSLTVSYLRTSGAEVKIVDGAPITLRANEQTSVFLMGPIESTTLKVVTNVDPQVAASGTTP